MSNVYISMHMWEDSQFVAEQNNGAHWLKIKDETHDLVSLFFNGPLPTDGVEQIDRMIDGLQDVRANMLRDLAAK